MKVENHLIYSAITFEIHLLNHHYHFVKIDAKKKRGKRKNAGKNPFSASSDSFGIEDGSKKKIEFNLETGDENSGNIRSDFSILLHLLVCTRFG